MRIFVDRHIPPQFALTGQRDDLGDRRRYYVSRQKVGRLVVIVCRNSLELADLAGETVDASLGWESGTRGFVQDINVGKRHTKLTIYRKSADKARTSLTKIVRDAPKGGIA